MPKRQALMKKIPMKTLYYCILLFSGITVLSCHSGSGTGPGPVSTGVIVPLEAGNKWYYDKITYTNGTQSSESVDSIQVTSDIKFNTTNNFDGYNYDGWRYVANISDGFYHFGTDLNFNGKQLWYKYPANVGDVFRWGPQYKDLPFPTSQKPDSVTKLTANDFTVVRTNYSVTVAAGTFSCYEYKTDYKDWTGKIMFSTIEFLAPNVGKIQEQNFTATPSSPNSLLPADIWKLTSKKIH